MENTLLAYQTGSIIQQEIGFVILLTVAALVAIVIRRVRFPYTVALVLVGLVLSFFPNVFTLDVSSDLILAVLVPPLIFEATLNIKWPELREDFPLVLLLALGGTLLGTILVGLLVFQFLDIPLLGALAFGALISTTDPVAVVAFFRSLGVSKRLSILMEGESLFNDGVAIVIFNLALAAAAAASITKGNSIDFSLAEAVFEFLRVSLGGIGIGLILGFIVSYVILKNVDDHLIETATTVALAFGAYVAAERLHVSGILSVVAAGLMVGNIGIRNTSPTTKLTLDNFWEFMAFVANSLVFLLIGLEILVNQLVTFALPIFVAVVAVLLSRAITVYFFTGLHNRFVSGPRAVPRSYQHIMFWGGLRGAISLALVLTLGNNLFGSTIALELRVMTFGVVLFTILFQGLTIQRLIQYLGLAQWSERTLENQRRQVTAYAKRAGRRELDRLHDEGILYRDIWEAMRTVYNEELDAATVNLGDHLEAHPELEQDMYLQARADVLKAERSAITDAANRGFITDKVLNESIRDINQRMAALDIITEKSHSPRSPASKESSDD
jgi:monovalent cation:H+ antiporter, CPA1 family